MADDEKGTKQDQGPKAVCGRKLKEREREMDDFCSCG
jgi:hypothetical protein